MDCERIQDLLSGFLEASLSDGDSREVVAHLRDCRDCLAAAEGLKETLSLLRRLPPEKAPPELVEGVRQRIAQESVRKPLWKRLLLPAHVKIPLEAAAAIALFLLVYGSVNREVPKATLSPPAARVEAPAPVARDGQNARAKAGDAVPASSEPVPGVRRRRPDAAGTGVSARGGGEPMPGVGARPPADPAGPVRIASAPREDGAALTPISARPQPHDSLPAVPAQRISTAGATIEPGAGMRRQGEEPAAMRIAEPPARLARTLPFGREVTIEVDAESRSGLEDRIAWAARRFGGSAHPEPALEGAAPAMRVHVPADAAAPFLAELRTLGTIPPEEAAGPSAPPDLSPDVLVYLVRIRAR